jgi:Holliday junction resolvase-like predicted endonuclease
LNLKPFIRGIGGIIPGGISVKDFAVVTETDQITAKEILEKLAVNEIGVFEGDIINFNSEDKLKSALFVLKQGASIEEISEQLNWQDFEALVADILKTKGFDVIQNFILTKPRMEIDVIGIKHGIAILIDCKHWKKQSMMSLQNSVTKQIERVKHYVANTDGVMAVPAIVTLYNEQINFIDKVPIVPILQFASFVEDFYGNLDEIKIIEK